MLRTGRISEIDADKARVRVTFPADGVTTGWLQTLHHGTVGNSYFHTYKVDELVAVALEGDGVYGFVLGSIYPDGTVPAESGSKIVSVVFDNGDKIVYDGTTGAMELKASGGITITGDVTVTGSVDASGQIKSDTEVKAGLISLSTHTHTTPTTGTITATETTTPPLP